MYVVKNQFVKLLKFVERNLNFKTFKKYIYNKYLKLSSLLFNISSVWHEVRVRNEWHTHC
jgi:hypothetical protein